MGIFDFFKAKKPIVEIKTIKFDEVDKWVLDEKEQIAIKETNCINLIKENIKILVKEFEGEIRVINNIDLKDRKVEEKIKLIVLENAKTFADYVKRLKESLEELEVESLEGLIDQINKNFLEFKKRSFMSKEKATYLIGKEIEEVMKSIDLFYKNTGETLKENQKIIESSKIINKSDKIYREISETDKIINKLYEDLKEIEKTEYHSEEKIKILEIEIEKIKTSKEYSQKLEKKQILEKEKQELKKEIASLNTLINLKELAKTHHSIQKNMKIIHEYAENIQEAFEKDKGESILELVTQNKQEIIDKINKILAKEKQISEFVHEKDEIIEIKEEIKHIKIKIQENKDEKDKLDKRILQYKDKTLNLKKELASELEKINLKLEIF